MNLEKIKVPIIFIIIIIIMLLGVLFWNKIIDKEPPKTFEDSNYIDVSDANNVANIDAKLGQDIRITSGYLLNYTTKKSSIWYMSNAYIVSIKKEKEQSIIKLSADKNSQAYIEAYIDNTNLKVKKGQNINFVGNIDLSNNQLKLIRISTDSIDYKDVTEIEFSKLQENISLLAKTTFTISGYMITDNQEYKLFDTKSAYESNNNAGNYFLINWQDEFNLTGNDDVKITCSLNGTYKLKDCILK